MSIIGAHKRILNLLIVQMMWIISGNVLIAETRDPIILHHADVLSGSESPTGPIRQCRGNVYLSQGNVSVKCDYALWNINSNSVEMTGNVIIQQGTMTLSMPSGSYDGGSKLARGRGGVKVIDRGRTVKALYGDYSTESYLARFFGNVSVEDDSTLIHADSAHYERASRRSLAFGKVVVLSKNNPAIIEGVFAESIPNEEMTRITGRPVLFLIDSTKKTDTIRIERKQETGKNSKKNIQTQDSISIKQSFAYDTMTVIADTLETSSSRGNMYVAKQNVEIIRSGMAGICTSASFKPDNDTLRLEGKPIMWFDSTMMTADSMYILMKKRSLVKIDATGSAFTLTKDDTLRPQRAQQLSGKHIAINVKQDTIFNIVSEVQAKSLYFLLSEKGIPEGAAKNSCDTIVVRFEAGEPESIIWIGGVQGEVYPEHEIEGREMSFDLPGRPEERKRPIKRSRQYLHH
jgi:hypothetical protein